LEKIRRGEGRPEDHASSLISIWQQTKDAFLLIQEADDIYKGFSTASANSEVLEIYERQKVMWDRLFKRWEAFNDGFFHRKEAPIPEEIPLALRERDQLDDFFDHFLYTVIQGRMGSKEANVVKYFYYRGMRDVDKTLSMVDSFQE